MVAHQNDMVSSGKKYELVICCTEVNLDGKKSG